MVFLHFLSFSSSLPSHLSLLWLLRTRFASIVNFRFWFSFGVIDGIRHTDLVKHFDRNLDKDKRNVIEYSQSRLSFTALLPFVHVHSAMTTRLSRHMIRSSDVVTTHKASDSCYSSLHIYTVKRSLTSIASVRVVAHNNTTQRRCAIRFSFFFLCRETWPNWLFADWCFSDTSTTFTIRTHKLASQMDEPPKLLLCVFGVFDFSTKKKIELKKGQKMSISFRIDAIWWPKCEPTEKDGNRFAR